MIRVVAVGIALLLLQPTLAFADSRRGSEAFSQGDYAAANHEWRESAAAGDASGMLGVGLLYDTGHGEPQDFAQALSWYRRAAEAGDAHAMFNVGAMYDNGRGTGMDRREAVKWYAKSAAKGNGRAAYAAATLYRDGDGIPQNTAAAIKFFKLAAAAGIGAARANLANLGQNASPNTVANSSLPPGKAPGSATATEQNPSAAQPMQTDTATAKAEASPSPAVSLPVPAKDVATAEPPGAPLAKPPAPEVATGAPRGVRNNDFGVAAADAPVGPMKPSGSPSVQVIAPGPLAPGALTTGALTAGIERFHKIALQRANVSATSSKQYERIFGEVIREAMDGDEVAQYDAAFAYERGVGVPSDLVSSYVYYIRAALSPDAGLKSAALRGAFEVGSRLTDAQQASAADMLARGLQ